MIDVHCHLEQKEYANKLDELIPKWKQTLKFIISSCAHPQDLQLTWEIYKKFRPFVKICIGLHPEYIKELKEDDIEQIISFIKLHQKDIVAIGEIGLDYHWVKEPEFQEKQKEMFRIFIKLAKELNLPIVIHSRDAREDTIQILKQEGMKDKKVLMHLMNDKESLQRIIENNWFVSIGPGIAKSKDIKKIARDMPLNRILLETDSPWFAQKEQGQEFGEPINVKIACEKIAEIKKISVEDVEKQTDLNAKEFFNLR
jgi:TatD DNase family protein